MAFGFLLEDGLEYSNPTTTSSTSVVPDKGLNRNITPNVIVSQFGDGYQQRVANGINSINENYTLSFSNRPKVEIDAIVSTLNTRKGVTAFNFTLDDEQASGNTVTIKVICQKWSVVYAHNNNYTLNATLKRVYEP